jgi:hypothetical protein
MCMAELLKGWQAFPECINSMSSERMPFRFFSPEGHFHLYEDPLYQFLTILKTYGLPAPLNWMFR